MSRNNKMMFCKSCSAPMAKSAKVCPSCGELNKKPFYKKWWVILIAIIIVFGVIGSNGKGGEEASDMDLVESPAESDSVVETTVAETEAETVAETEAETAPETEAPTAGEELIDGMRPDFKNAMDSYEIFMNEYCDFMVKYNESDGTDLQLLADYADYISKYSDAMEAIDKWDSEEMNAAETAYYIDVQSRIAQRLLEVSE